VKKHKHGRGKEGPDGLTSMERRFAERRRSDPESPGWEVAKAAGYQGNRIKLTSRAADLMRKPEICRAVYAPLPPSEYTSEERDDQLRAKIRRRLELIIDSKRATDSDAIKAADKLLATIPGGFVPVQVVQKGSYTLESWVRQMGGAPELEVVNREEESA
jgi:hypothetical protein